MGQLFFIEFSMQQCFSCPSSCAQSNSNPIQSNDASQEQEEHMKKTRKSKRKQSITSAPGAEHGTVDSLWQWRQWKTSPQQGARIRHLLRQAVRQTKAPSFSSLSHCVNPRTKRAYIPEAHPGEPAARLGVVLHGEGGRGRQGTRATRRRDLGGGAAQEQVRGGGFPANAQRAVVDWCGEGQARRKRQETGMEAADWVAAVKRAGKAFNATPCSEYQGYSQWSALPIAGQAQRINLELPPRAGKSKHPQTPGPCCCSRHLTAILLLLQLGDIFLYIFGENHLGNLQQQLHMKARSIPLHAPVPVCRISVALPIAPEEISGFVHLLALPTHAQRKAADDRAACKRTAYVPGSTSPCSAAAIHGAHANGAGLPFPISSSTSELLHAAAKLSGSATSMRSGGHRPHGGNVALRHAAAKLRHQQKNEEDRSSQSAEQRTCGVIGSSWPPI
nr:unnamed protein product [Digitaria exilis]